jgi:integrase
MLANYDRYDLVFAASNGLPRSLNNLNRREFQAIMGELKLEGYSVYSLRHSCVTLSLAAGVNPKAIAEKVGHSGIDVLLSTYAHVLNSMRKETTEKLAATLYD